MIVDFRQHMAEVVVWAFLATMGLTWLMLLAREGLERAANWWQERRSSDEEPGEPELLHEWHDHAPLGYHDEAVTGCPACETRWDLPPERTWEQMTSHQLPLEAGAADHFPRPPGYLADGTRGLDSAGIVRAHEPWRVEAHLSAARERRAPWWEAEHRAAYESLGLDYPSGLLARVREAGQ